MSRVLRSHLHLGAWSHQVALGRVVKNACESGRSHEVALGRRQPSHFRSQVVSHPFRGGTMRPTTQACVALELLRWCSRCRKWRHDVRCGSVPQIVAGEEAPPRATEATILIHLVQRPGRDLQHHVQRR